MSNNNQFNLAYPNSEKAVTLVFNENLPITCLFIGITFPLSTYKILRNDNNNQTLFEYVLDGQGEIVINKTKYPLIKGDVFVLRKNTRHDYRSNKNNPLKKIWVSFESSYLEKMLEDYNIKSGVYHADLENLFLALYDIAKSQTSPQNKLFPIADNIHQIITTLSRKILLSMDDDFSSIKNEILSSVYGCLSIDSIAAKLYMSKSNVIRIFKKRTGVTPYSFLLNEKLNVAKTLLSSTDITIKNISELLGFSDEHYFSRLFKEKIGKSPTKYRKL